LYTSISSLLSDFLDAAFLNLLQRKVRYNYTIQPGLLFYSYCMHSD
jgi:hypothetical protein